MHQPLECQPGTLFRYSDDNYQVAAAIVEIVTGQKFEDFVSRKLLSPAGLSRTGFVATLEASDVLPVKAVLPHRMRVRQWGELGAGGMFSTTGDLFAWYDALSVGNIVTLKSVEKMFSAHAKTQERWAALGWCGSPKCHPPRVARFFLVQAGTLSLH